VRIAVIVPCLNEARHIVSTLSRLQYLRQNGHQLIVVDGQSTDASVALATPLADNVVSHQRGRALQLNHGAQITNAELLLFLHADTQLPDNADTLIIEQLAKSKRQWGRFNVRLSGKHYWLRVIEFMMNTRSRWSGIATGDQAIFVDRELFKKVGGFPEISLMEDICLCKHLKPYSKPLCLSEPVITSSRRWEEKGIWRTILLMWRLRLAYFLGIDTKQLKRQYDN